jgi:probable F420-dependent oxidoreductase
MRRIGVGLGIMEFPFSAAAAYWRWVDLCEAGGVDSLWQSDRIIGREPVLESLAAMAALAGRTRRLKFGMNVLSLSLRDPVLVAKQCATIDYLSDGRLLPAFGIGSPMIADWTAMGIPAAERGSRTDEGLEILRRLWAGDSVDFSGRHFQLSGAVIAPLPVQAELPIWIGGSSDAAIRRTARFGTGWQAAGETAAEIGPVIGRIREAAAAAGRRIDEDHFGAGFPYRFGRADDPAVAAATGRYARLLKDRDPMDYFAVGDADTILEHIAAYVEAGASKFVLRPVATGDEDILEQTRLLIEQVLPRVAQRWPKN